MKQSATPRLDSRDMVRVKTLEIAWHNVDKENVRTCARLDALDSTTTTTTPYVRCD